MEDFVLQFGILVLAAKTGGKLFERWHLPKVLGELLAGIIVGPFLLGHLALPGFPQGVMANAGTLLSSRGPVYGVAMLSMAVLFFLVGLEADLRQLRRSSLVGIFSGVGGFLLCFATSCALFLFWETKGKAASLPFDVLFVGLLVSTLVSITSVGLLARLLAIGHRLESQAGAISLAAGMMDNALGLFVFFVLAAIPFPSGDLENGSVHLFCRLFGWTALKTVLYVAAVVLCGIPVARRMNTLALREKNYASAFAVSAACLLIAGGLSAAFGVSPLAGAYAMGVAFAATDLRHEIRERLDFVSEILIPACFALIGTQLNLSLLGDSSLLFVSLLFSVVVLLIKFASSAGMTLLFRRDLGLSVRVGVATLPRGELSMAMLLTLLTAAPLMKTVEPFRCLGIATWLIVLSCLISPALAQLAFRRDDAEPGNVQESERIVFHFPSHDIALLVIDRAVEIFEDDGFYAQLLNRYQVIYRISRGPQVIHLEGPESDVIFACAESVRTLVNTVMLEISSGAEQSLRELQKPLDGSELRRQMHQTCGTGRTGLLRATLDVDALAPRLQASTLPAAVTELLNLLDDDNVIKDRDAARNAVLARGAWEASCLESGVAVPHARTDAVSRLVCAVGLRRDGMAVPSADGKPARIIILVLAPASAATPQLQLIAQLCRILDDKGRAALLACATAEEMASVLLDEKIPKAGRKAAPSADNPIAACLNWQSISLDMRVGTPAGACSFLLALCARSGAVAAMDEMVDEINARRNDKPQGGEEGALFFVFETSGVYRPVAALGVHQKTEACAGRIGVMLLYPPAAREEAQRMEQAFHAVLTPVCISALFTARTSQEALASLQQTLETTKMAFDFSPESLHFCPK